MGHTLKRTKVLFILLFMMILSMLGSVHAADNLSIANDSPEERYFYVSPAGDDSNPGTLTSPWRTIQKAANTVSAGDTVFVRSGIYREFVEMKRSGSADDGAITFRNYPGETPIIDGVGLVVDTKHQSLIRISSADHLIVEGFELRNLETADPSLDPAGIRIKDGGSYIQLINNHIHHISNTAIDGNAHGIHILGNTAKPMTNVWIMGNDVHDLVTGKSESVTLSGNIDGFAVVGNTVHNNNNIGIVLAGHYKACTVAGCVDQTRNGIVSKNVVYHIDSSVNPAYDTRSAGGIYVDGGTQIIIEHNHLYENNFGIELASEKKGRTTSHIIVRNNLIRHNHGAGLIMGGSTSSNGGTTDNLIANNTLIANDSLDQGYGDITLQWHNNNNTIMNNIIYSKQSTPGLHKGNDSGSNNVVDYNLYYNMSGRLSKNWNWNGVSHATWQDYRRETGQDLHSIFAAPLFMDIAALDIRLQPSSPAIDRGKLYWQPGSIDWLGSSRITGFGIDMGATEYNKDTTYALIQVDGKTDDWAEIMALSESESKQMRVLRDISVLHLLIQGERLDQKSQLYFNTDNWSDTGYAAHYWEVSGADYLLENGVLYQYSGETGKEWAWERVHSYKGTERYTTSPTVIEASIPYVDLGISNGQSIQIGYVGNDTASEILPIDSDGLLEIE